MLTVESLGFDRGDIRILDEVSFRMLAGEKVALLGANGSGKTTLARLLNGTLHPSRGRVTLGRLDTREAQDLPEIRRQVGLLFQDPDNQFVSTTAEREIAFGLENLGLATGEIRRRVEEALERFDLGEFRQSPPHEMSGGEKARLALASVWVMEPKWLILDETENLLDRRARLRLREKTLSLLSETGVLRLTTDAETAAAADRLLVLHHGRLIADGSPDDVFERLPQDIAAAVGLPWTWQISARLMEQGRLERPTCSWTTLTSALGIRER